MTVRDIKLEGKHVLMRVDFNVPMANGVVTDDKRIKAALPTIQYVIDQGASLVLMSHLGRPRGTGFEPEFSLKPASEVLAKFLDDISDDDIVELNIPTGVPLVYELDANLRPIKHYYLGDPNEIRKAEEAVVAQGQAQ